MTKIVVTTSVVERKYPQLPRFVCIPRAKLAQWKLTSTVTIEGSINGYELGRRSLKLWADRDSWWIDLPETLCRKANIETGGRVHLRLRIAPEQLPQELADLIEKDSTARANWEKLTSGQKRMLREEVIKAKEPATRARRAARVLLAE